MPDVSYTDYDRFAWIYNRYWGDFASRALPALEKLALNTLPAGGRVLDVCCGTGQLAALLAERGCQVTGVDGSPEMIRHARENAPGCAFIVADARALQFPPEYDAAFSTFDSLNHLMTTGDLLAAFRGVRAALKTAGVFVFDMNLEAGYVQRWRGSYGQVADDHAFIVRSAYDPAAREGRFDITIFSLEEAWQRTDLTLTQRCYSEAEIRAALEEAGFADIAAHDAVAFNMAQTSGERAFFVCR